jgi:hypothetical protein
MKSVSEHSSRVMISKWIGQIEQKMVDSRRIWAAASSVSQMASRSMSENASAPMKKDPNPYQSAVPFKRGSRRIISIISFTGYRVSWDIQSPQELSGREKRNLQILTHASCVASCRSTRVSHQYDIECTVVVNCRTYTILGEFIFIQKNDTKLSAASPNDPIGAVRILLNARYICMLPQDSFNELVFLLLELPNVPQLMAYRGHQVPHPPECHVSFSYRSNS